jgi:NitT/TauT family transport system substrate-binding protein
MQLVRALAVLFAAALCSATAHSQSNGALKPVSLRLDFLAGAEHAPYYAALREGYYKEAGLDVTIGPGQGSNVTAQLVSGGRDTFGLVGAATVLSSVANKMPIKAIATVVPHTQTGLLVPAGTQVENAKWMTGKRIAVVTASYTYNEMKAVLATNGMKETDIVPVNVNGLLTPSLLRKQADAAVVLRYVDGIFSKQQGYAGEFVPFAKFGVDNPAMTIVANTSTISSDPDLVRAFLKASLRGWEFARKNPEAAYRDFVASVPTAENPFNAAKLVVVVPEVFVSGHRWGESRPEPWSSMATSLEKLGLLPSNVPLSDVYTNAFLP